MIRVNIVTLCQIFTMSLSPYRESLLSPLQHRCRDIPHLNRVEIACGFHERSFNYKLNVTKMMRQELEFELASNAPSRR